jgi:mannose-6-phosphate isomerase-like protein (cupin superfamily)
VSTARLVHADPDSEYFFEEGCHITEWWNSPDDPAVSIARARVEPDCTTRWHRLRDTVERYVVLSGRGLVEVAGLPATEVRCGAVVMIPAGVDQRIACLGDADLVFLAICTPRFERGCYADAEPETGAG